VFRLIIWPEIIRALAEFVPDLDVRLGVLQRLRDRLETDPSQYRRIRDMDDPDFLFDYVDVVHFDGRWRTIRFSVNDTTAEGHLFVEAVSCR